MVSDPALFQLRETHGFAEEAFKEDAWVSF